MRPRDVHAVTGLSGVGARAILERLAVQTLVSPLEGAETPIFVLAEHLEGRLGRTGQVGDQVDAAPPDLVTDQAGAERRSRSLTKLGHSRSRRGGVENRDVLRRAAVHGGYHGRTGADPPNLLPPQPSGTASGRRRDPHDHPDQPNHPDQAYVLTEAGVAIKARRVNGDAGMGNGDRTNAT